MFNRHIIAAIIFLWCTSVTNAQSIHWLDFNQQAFDQAQQQHKPVLLDLGASWCHWCHVMDDSTYEDSTVTRYLVDHYICIKANQDKRPDLYAKYKDYGWPATIIFHEDAKELVKEAGFIGPTDFLVLLKKTYNGYRYIEPQKQIASNPVITGEWSARTAAFVRNNFFEYLDMIDGGYDMQQHFLEYDGIEYALRHYKTNNQLKKWLPLTIHGSYRINDPAWGGVYQYSTNGNWDHPHFEKILSIQARYIKIYAQYYEEMKDSSALSHAKNIISYLNTFLHSKNNLYYNSQDADLKEGEHAGGFFALSSANRYKQGIPRIDSTCYSKENAQLADAFLYLYNATNDKSYIITAGNILAKLKKDFKQPDGSYVHDRAFTSSIALADQLYLCQALLHYYNITKDTAALQEARSLGNYMLAHFKGKNKALYSFSNNNKYLPPDYVLSENIDACRVFQQLAQYGNTTYKTAGENIFGYISSPAVLKTIIAEPGILTAKEILH
ncbi:hypothetical protein CLV51_1011608 [Chitinophaga niastensis]|uniref:Spermatogenesis-associated protein 20-like TRX domain-containing protein n=1 Tax=Chitinophaga niastensis TaxID=536980 RepID=A0A2P8HVS3_CHINA|nr:DUF255 domain-containing protein [Chitinophaga niastensis]PSL50264.1 hypothetical protein CLV51_1011608 [Chitinophaga niastensis]